MHNGHITPREAFQRLQNNVSAVLIDVRTQPEWAFVGVPAIERLVRICWQTYPAMAINPEFLEEVRMLGLTPTQEILCICRSGARSSHAASALTQAGFSQCWNVAEGFEGDKNDQGHRGLINGWKVAGLPWVQS